MEKITNIQELNAAIVLLEQKQVQQERLLKQQFKETYENIKPINFIRNTFKELVTAPDFKEDVLNTSISLAAGYLSKKLAIGTTNNPLKQILGSFLQIGVTSLVSKNSDNIRAKVREVVNVVFDKKVE
jgi:MFS-type transporter involved in bile tolerance (Atg22 family)